MDFGSENDIILQPVVAACGHLSAEEQKLVTSVCLIICVVNRWGGEDVGSSTQGPLNVPTAPNAGGTRGYQIKPYSLLSLCDRPHT